MEGGSAQPLAVLRQYGLVIGLFILGLVFFLYGLIQFIGNDSTDDVTFHTQAVTPLITHPIATEIVVDIEGAVKSPGVYTLSGTNRLQDVIVKAGGFTSTVDREKVAKGLNLAEKVMDGAKIYIPFLGEEDTASIGVQTSLNSGQTVLGVSNTTSGLININTASSEQLDTLPGVGAVTAGKIIANRPYSSTQELVTKKAVGQATYEKVKDMITTN